jgi:Ulp1 family protease
MGRHWIAYFIDIPNLEVNYYDSLTENDGEPPKESLKGLKKIIDKIHPEYYLLFKYNQIQDQSPSSKNCGYFALKFIMDRYRNVPFKVASGFDKHYYAGEKMIKRFKKYL